MRQHTQDHAAVLPVTCLGLLLLFCLWFMNPVGSGAAVIPPNSPKYEIDIASGTVRTYKLIKANSEWIRWKNSTSTYNSVYFVSHDSPFDTYCWDVPKGQNKEAVKIVVDPGVHEYHFDRSKLTCASDPHSDPDRPRSTPKVIIQ
jgi:hypothetical protein